MIKKAEYKVIDGDNTGALQSEIAKLTIGGQFWRPILMTSVFVPAGAIRTTVIMERVLEST